MNTPALFLRRSTAAHQAAGQLDEAVRSLVAGHTARSLAALSGIDQEALLTDRLSSFETLRTTKAVAHGGKAPTRPATLGRRIAVPFRVRTAVFERDHYICVYCGIRTVDPEVLKLLSRIVPDAIPFHSHWKDKEVHILQWSISTSLDHRVPVALGGTSSIDNLLTTCYQCNDLKKQMTLENLAWKFHVPPVSGWKGLSEFVPRLKSLCDRIGPEEHTERSAAVGKLTIDEHWERQDIRREERIVTDIRVGLAVQAVANGHTQPRNYRIEYAGTEQILGREFWFSDRDGKCTYSKGGAKPLIEIRKIRAGAPPIDGLAREEQPKGTFVT